MARSRTDELLEGWKMVAHTARRPAIAPRRQISRNGLSAGTLVAFVVAIVVIIALSSRGSSPAPQPTLPAVGEPTASASSVPSVIPSASAPAASTASVPTPTAGTPTAADVAAARSAINTYTADLVHGKYAAAWAMLGPEDSLRTLTLAQYSSAEKDNFAGLKGEYTIKVSPPDVAPITDSRWTAGLEGVNIDFAHAVLVEVDYIVLAGNNAGYDIFIVNPTATGLEIYDVR